jgi:hypothetical protein
VTTRHHALDGFAWLRSPTAGSLSSFGLWTAPPSILRAFKAWLGSRFPGGEVPAGVVVRQDGAPALVRGVMRDYIDRLQRKLRRKKKL